MKERVSSLRKNIFQAINVILIKMEENKEVIQRVMEIKHEDVDSCDQDPYPRTWLIYYSLDHDILGSSKKECFYSMMLISVFEK